MQACRNALNGIQLQNGQHAGLLLSRFLKIAVKNEKHPTSRKELHDTAVAAVQASQQLYKRAFDRWQASLPDPCKKQVLHVQDRVIVGLGGENVLETGITLHHTYGVPIIPGSALKGLAAHYVAQVWGATDPKWKKHGEHHVTVFGGHDDAGHVVFHDAWIDPESLARPNEGLVRDVMTPHHGDYYAKKTYKDGPKKDELIPPTDFDDPNPVTFLSVAGRFLVAISCDTPGPEGEKWAALAFDLLREALREWGAGGKTSSGYGQMGERSASGNSAVGDGKMDKTALPNAGERVEAVLLDKKTKKGGWKAKFEPASLSGPIQNSADVPSDKRPGDKLTLIVAFANPREIAFRYPTVTDERRAAKAARKSKPALSGRRGKGGNRR